eukprot:2836982-Prymnesium_polylepis.1
MKKATAKTRPTLSHRQAGNDGRRANRDCRRLLVQLQFVVGRRRVGRARAGHHGITNVDDFDLFSAHHHRRRGAAASPDGVEDATARRVARLHRPRASIVGLQPRHFVKCRVLPSTHSPRLSLAGGRGNWGAALGTQPDDDRKVETCEAEPAGESDRYRAQLACCTWAR